MRGSTTDTHNGARGPPLPVIKQGTSAHAQHNTANSWLTKTVTSRNPAQHKASRWSQQGVCSTAHTPPPRYKQLTYQTVDKIDTRRWRCGAARRARCHSTTALHLRRCTCAQRGRACVGEPHHVGACTKATNGNIISRVRVGYQRWYTCTIHRHRHHEQSDWLTHLTASKKSMRCRGDCGTPSWTKACCTIRLYLYDNSRRQPGDGQATGRRGGTCTASRACGRTRRPVVREGAQGAGQRCAFDITAPSPTARVQSIPRTSSGRTPSCPRPKRR
jgi:hypothetical protein